MCVMFLHYISDEKIKTTRDQVTNTNTNTQKKVFKYSINTKTHVFDPNPATQSNISVSKFALLNSVDSLTFQF